ncbi:phospholipase A2 inhibitor and Ly6/PLAUR domain-containing protein-like [Pelobates fuscus]|uniref:phospholipase A2 inhibitor and Ly6/PLAUR domain-containing protein-like n=1 Tax=Pelobates fuscus TaxID=191477 RepID=UPI002FE4CEEA
MKRAMLIIIVCSALVTIGAALKCEVCYSPSSNSCSGHYETCSSSQDRCMETLTQTSMGDVESVVFEKSCGSLYKCTHPASMTAPNYRVSVTTLCCDTDYCNNRTMNWKTENSTLNGMNCPSCFSKNSETCDKLIPLNCTGNETHCIQFTATRHRGSPVTMAGCATENMKKSQGKAAFWGESIQVSRFKALNGGMSLQAGCLPTILAILTAMKIRSTE